MAIIMMITNFSRDIVFSVDLRYNEANEKPSSGRKVARRSRDGRSLRDFRFRLNVFVTRSPSVSPTLDSSLPEGAFGYFHLRGMGFARSLCNTKAKHAIKQNDK